MEGYARLSHLMGTYSEFAILRRFRDLNMQNLLYLQAEIIHLEEELRKAVSDDARYAQRHYYPYDWWSLAHGDDDESDDEPSEQWRLMLEIREKLENYNEALLKHAAILRLDNPSSYDLGFLRRWLERPSMGSFPLCGSDRTSWDEDHERDLLSLKTRTAPDLFSRWFTESVIPTLHHRIGRKFKNPVSQDLGNGLYEYDDKVLQNIARVTSTVVASVLPLFSIVLLYIIQHNGIRLGVIVILSAFFSLALALMTNARKIEIFAATSAFAAVNVVYLTNGPVCTIQP